MVSQVFQADGHLHPTSPTSPRRQSRAFLQVARSATGLGLHPGGFHRSTEASFAGKTVLRCSTCCQ